MLGFFNQLSVSVGRAEQVSTWDAHPSLQEGAFVVSLQVELGML